MWLDKRWSQGLRSHTDSSSSLQHYPRGTHKFVFIGEEGIQRETSSIQSCWNIYSLYSCKERDLTKVNLVLIFLCLCLLLLLLLSFTSISYTITIPSPPPSIPKGFFLTTTYDNSNNVNKLRYKKRTSFFSFFLSRSISYSAVLQLTKEVISLTTIFPPDP